MPSKPDLLKEISDLPISFSEEELLKIKAMAEKFPNPVSAFGPTGSSMNQFLDSPREYDPEVSRLFRSVPSPKENDGRVTE